MLFQPPGGSNHNCYCILFHEAYKSIDRSLIDCAIDMHVIGLCLIYVNLSSSLQVTVT